MLQMLAAKLRHSKLLFPQLPCTAAGALSDVVGAMPGVLLLHMADCKFQATCSISTAMPQHSLVDAAFHGAQP